MGPEGHLEEERTMRVESPELKPEGIERAEILTLDSIDLAGKEGVKLSDRRCRLLLSHGVIAFHLADGSSQVLVVGRKGCAKLIMSNERAFEHRFKEDKGGMRGCPLLKKQACGHPSSS